MDRTAEPQDSGSTSRSALGTTGSGLSGGTATVPNAQSSGRVRGRGRAGEADGAPLIPVAIRGQWLANPLQPDRYGDNRSVRAARTRKTRGRHAGIRAMRVPRAAARSTPEPDHWIAPLAAPVTAYTRPGLPPCALARVAPPRPTRIRHAAVCSAQRGDPLPRQAGVCSVCHRPRIDRIRRRQLVALKAAGRFFSGQFELSRRKRKKYRRQARISAIGVEELKRAPERLKSDSGAPEGLEPSPAA